MKRPPLEDVRQLRRDLQAAFIDARKDKNKDDATYSAVVVCLQLLDWIVDGRDTVAVNICREYIAKHKEASDD